MVYAAPKKKTLDSAARRDDRKTLHLTREGLHPYDFFANETAPDYLSRVVIVTLSGAG
jgi:hypothetical protein